MISVLIADDEYLLRQLIRNSVQWDALEMEVVAEAEDGEKALRCIRELEPDIALIDINMPVINGIDLAKMVYEAKYPTRLLLLTGYREFEYAQKAVTYRVFDYLLKPIKTEELTAALEKACGDILRERDSARRMDERMSQRQRGMQMLKERLLSGLAQGSVSFTPTQLAHELACAEISLSPEHLNVLVIEIDCLPREEEASLYLFAIANVAAEILRGDARIPAAEAFLERQESAVLVCNAPDAGAVKAAAQQILAFVRAHFPFTISIGVSGEYTGFLQLRFAVEDARAALDRRFYENGDRVFFEKPAHPAAEQSPHLLPLMELSDIHGTENVCERIAAGFAQMREKRVPEEHVKMVALSYLGVLYGALSKYDAPLLSDEYGGGSIVRQIMNANTFEQTQALLLSPWQEFSGLGHQKLRHISKLVLDAKEYIDGKYCHTDLSLNQIAAAVYANAAYVSTQFKKELGVSISEYITICRMRRATQLINQDPQITLGELSAKIGYNDPYYFSRSFKKHYGVPPSRYIAGNAAPSVQADQ